MRLSGANLRWFRIGQKDGKRGSVPKSPWGDEVPERFKQVYVLGYKAGRSERSRSG